MIPRYSYTGQRCPDFPDFQGCKYPKQQFSRIGMVRPREDPVAQDLIVLTSTGSVLSKETQSETHMTSGHCKWFVCNIFGISQTH